MELTAEDLNGFEMLEIKKILGTSIEKADGIELTYALAYIFQKRENAEYRWDNALAMTLKEVQAYLGVSDEELAAESQDPFDESPDPKA